VRARCIYDEALDLREIGALKITRASHVEPDAEGYWWADMGPSGGPVLGPFMSRTEALGAERGWLNVRPFFKAEDNAAASLADSSEESPRIPQAIRMAFSSF
jgi:hypothetical protein